MLFVRSRRAIVPIVVITVLVVAWIARRTEPIESADRVGFVAPRGIDPTPEIVASEGVEGDRGVEIVSYDAASDRVSLSVHNVSLAAVVEALQAATGIEIVALDPALLAGSISIELDGVSLAEALYALFGRFNKAVISISGSERADGAPQITRVLIANRRSDPAPERVDRARDIERASTRADEPTSWSPAPTEDPSVTLVQAVVSNDADGARGIVEYLVESGVEAEKQHAAETLLESIGTGDPSAFALAVEALKELAPERAVEELSERLAGDPVPGDSGEGSLDDEDPKAIVQRQIMVAKALGEIGGPEAVDPLIEAFHQPEGGVRQIAANGLAAIGDPHGEDFLLEATKNPSLEWRRPAALAIVLRGSPEAKAALAEQISQGSVQTEGIPQVVLALLAEQ